MMKYYYAPMEGITGYLHRKASHTAFGKIDKYFAPFIVPNQNRKLNAKERADLDPANNEGMYLVPQILTNNAADFLDYEKILSGLGYGEVNINLGCPSKTVVSKGRGSGFLAMPEELDHFLEEIFSRCKGKVSVKTRIGKDTPDEFPKLLEIYNKYPLEELIVHPRTQQEMYRGTTDLDAYRYAVSNSKNSVCYNGDVFGPTFHGKLLEQFPGTEAVMLGRGLLINPALVNVLKGEGMAEKEAIRRYHDDLYEAYRRHMPGDRVVLFKMKEHWVYLRHLFEDSKKYAKRIHKAERRYAYEDAVNELFADCELVLYDERIFKIK